MKRVDSTWFLYHWVKSDPHTRSVPVDYETAFSVFMKILWDSFLKHGDLIKTGGSPCICFTESPEYFMHSDKSKYQPFGFKFLKQRIFQLGGRAAIYAPDYEKNLIHESMMWRYMRHDPLSISERTPYGVDFTWEREWRLPVPELEVSEALKIIVPDASFVDRVILETENWLNQSANFMHQYTDGYYYEPHPDVMEYVMSVRRKLSTPEIFS